MTRTVAVDAIGVLVVCLAKAVAAVVAGLISHVARVVAVRAGRGIVDAEGVAKTGLTIALGVTDTVAVGAPRRITCIACAVAI